MWEREFSGVGEVSKGDKHGLGLSKRISLQIVIALCGDSPKACRLSGLFGLTNCSRLTPTGVVGVELQLETGSGVVLLDLCSRGSGERSLRLLNIASDAISEWGVVLLDRLPAKDFSGDSLDSDFLFFL